VELIDHIYTTQTFNIAIELDEIVLRIEHTEFSDGNWIDSSFYAVYYDVLEETIEVDENGVIELFIGAIHNMDAMFINGVEVDFVTPEIGGAQLFVFNVEFE